MHKFCTAAKLRTRLTALVLTVALAVAALAPAAFAADENDFTITNGVLTGYTGPGGDVTIPDGVTSIGEGAFQGCSSLTSVTIPDGVTSIGEGAFEGCSNLTSVTIPDSVTSIGDGAFSDCTNLTSVAIPQGVTIIEPFAFSGCTSLTSVTIPDGVTSIGGSAFEGCSSLTSVTIPQGVTSIENSTFYGCTSLVSVTIPDGVTSIEPFAFEKCSALTSVTIPQGVTRICQQAFSGCTSLASVTIPNSVTIIDPFAFSDCSSLTSVTIPQGVTSIEIFTFSGCTSLVSVTIPDGVTSIGNSAFSYCSALTSVTIPGSVTSIGDEAFAYCSALTSVTFQGDYPATVGTGVFSGNNNLNSLLYPYGNASWAGKTAADLGALSTAKLLPYAQAAVSASTESTDLSSGSAVLAVTSSTIPFDPTQAEKLENYTISGGGQISLTSAGVDGTDAKTVRLTFQLPAARAARASISADIEIAPSAFAGVIVDETGSPVGPVTVPAAFSTPDPTYTVTVRYLYADGSQAAQPYTAVLANGAAYSVPSPAIAGYTPDKATVSGTVAGGNVEITVTYQPSNTGPVGPGSSGSDSGSSGGSGRPGTTPTKPPNQPPALTDAVSPIQNDAIQTGNIQRPNWIDRLTLPDYGRTLYDVMSGKTPGSQGQTRGLFEIQDHFKLAPKTTRKPMYRVNRIEEVEFSVLSPYSGGTSLDSTIFQDERFFTITPDAQDQAINYAGLTMGSFISTANFNGVYVTKLSYDAMTDAAKKETCEYIAAVFHAFDKDCPEIFWLSGKCKVRIVTVTNPDTKAKESYFFLVLADKDGFTMCAPAWTQSGSIAAGIARRDAAVSKILETVTAAAPVDQVKQLNKWLTENNQYNTSADLTAISNEPHECLAALEGRIAADGPVCDGYSRAFKVLCDRLGISCVLETGWAKATTGAAPPIPHVGPGPDG